MLYNGVLNGKTYKNVEVCSGTVEIARAAYPGTTAVSTSARYGSAAELELADYLAEGSAAAYISSDPAVASVDSETGEVRILKAGTVQITASASETADYAPADITYTLHIARRALAWDVSELTAVDREDKIADKKASLYGSLKVSGVLAADAEDAVFTCPADQLNGTYATVAAGSQKVALSWADAENPVHLQGEKAENYILPPRFRR